MVFSPGTESGHPRKLCPIWGVPHCMCVCVCVLVWALCISSYIMDVYSNLVCVLWSMLKSHASKGFQGFIKNNLLQMLTRLLLSLLMLRSQLRFAWNEVSHKVPLKNESTLTSLQFAVVTVEKRTDLFGETKQQRHQLSDRRIAKLRSHVETHLVVHIIKQFKRDALLIIDGLYVHQRDTRLLMVHEWQTPSAPLSFIYGAHTHTKHIHKHSLVKEHWDIPTLIACIINQCTLTFHWHI